MYILIVFMNIYICVYSHENWHKNNNYNSFQL